MGGTGGRFFRGKAPEQLQDQIRQLEDDTRDQSFEVDVSSTLGEYLSGFERRNAETETVNQALDEVKRSVQADIESSVDVRFGGSVRKHTYVDGISDVDTLLLLKDPTLRSQGPQAVLKYLEKHIHELLPTWEVSRGRLAITLRRSGTELQILPAVHGEKGMRIPSANGDAWSKINPQAFFGALTRANEQCGGKLVPVIKLAKLVNDRQPASVHLTGYHIESLAIEVFKGYSGTYNPKAMLEHFFKQASLRVLAPIKDRSGQSVHVDGYLGPAKGRNRQAVAAALDRVFRRMQNANANGDKQQWLEILEDE